VFGVFFAGAFFCLFVSAFFHLVSNHSYEVALIWNRCDYAGITFMIVGSSFPLIYFAFNCHPHMQVAALAFIILLGLASLPIVLLERFSKPKWRPIRSMLYVGLGCSGIAPMLYLAWEVGWAHVYNATALHWTTTMGALYIVGAVLYALRVPERHFPGKFDYFFHSHQVRRECGDQKDTRRKYSMIALMLPCGVATPDFPFLRAVCGDRALDRPSGGLPMAPVDALQVAAPVTPAIAPSTPPAGSVAARCIGKLYFLALVVLFTVYSAVISRLALSTAHPSAAQTFAGAPAPSARA